VTGPLETGAPSTAEPLGQAHARRVGPGHHVPKYASIWLATALLFAVSPVLAPGSLSKSALLSMLPFAAVLAIASIGQTLVIQQRGFDLSVAGMMTLSAVLITTIPSGDSAKLPLAIVAVAGACLASGVVNGIAISVIGITPLVATLGTNSLLNGVALSITSGASTSSVTTGLGDFALATSLGVPNTVLIAVAVVGSTATIFRVSVFGRRFVAVGTSPAAARASGIPVKAYEFGTYLLASLTYGVAAILVSGYLETPNRTLGDGYLLATIAAVVLGGSALTGGQGSVAATAVGALFLTQLGQVVTGLGAPASVQLIIQASIIALGIAIRNLPFSAISAASVRLRSQLLRRRSDSPQNSLGGAHDPSPLGVSTGPGSTKGKGGKE
jgi:ribose transport system permease protein